VLVFGSFILILASIALTVVIFALFFQQKVFQILRYMYLAQLFTIGSVFALVLLAMFNNGNGCFWAWACMLTSFLPWGSISQYMVFQSTIGIVRKVSLEKKTSVVDLIGGYVMTSVFIVTMILSQTLLVICGFGTAIAIDANDIVTAQKLWIGHCAGIFFFATIGGIFTSLSLYHASIFIENIANKAGGNQNHKDDKALHVAARFRASARNSLFGLPTGSILCLLHCIFLPIFWYIAFIHCITTTGSICAVWFLYTPKSQRIRFLTCGQFISLRIDTSNTNPENSRHNTHHNKKISNNNYSPLSSRNNQKQAFFNGDGSSSVMVSQQN
jgi:hypothetical protein